MISGKKSHKTHARISVHSQTSLNCTRLFIAINCKKTVGFKYLEIYAKKQIALVRSSQT